MQKSSTLQSIEGPNGPASGSMSPHGSPVAAFFGILGEAGSTEKTAVIEMAAASGLPLVPPERRDPRITTTWGTGELIRHALDRGCRRLLIGIGGSATNDGGAGLAQALGAQLLDEQGQELIGIEEFTLKRVHVSTAKFGGAAAWTPGHAGQPAAAGGAPDGNPAVARRP